MDRRKMDRVAIAFIGLVILVVAIMLVTGLHSSTDIVLPGEKTPQEEDHMDSSGEEVLTVVGVTPQTVQTAIATLERPETYFRTIRVQQYWEDGSGTVDFQVAASGKWTRTDRSLPNQQVRHSLTDGESTYVWYGGSHRVYVGPAGSITADKEQAIPTYEEILRLEEDEIAAADYRTISEDKSCIYVETQTDDLGYTMRYWVSLDSGLLIAAEKLLNGETIYRMSSPDMDRGIPEGAFTLPDGTILIQMETE